MMINKRTFLFFFLLLNQATVFAIEKVIDPLDSPSWQVMHEVILNNEPVVFDERVVVSTPDFAEDAMNVPVSVRVNEIKDIQEIVVFADLNPIQKVLNFKPVNIKPYLAFRIKVEQATPVRAAVKTADGVWHVGGRWLEAAGGGCTAPSLGRAANDWYATLMNVSSRTWHDEDNLDRLRFRIMHPMDTGLAEGIPEFFIEQFSVLDQSGKTLATLDTYQPISENPVFTFDLKSNLATNTVQLVGKDNNGNRIDAIIK